MITGCGVREVKAVNFHLIQQLKIPHPHTFLCQALYCDLLSLWVEHELKATHNHVEIKLVWVCVTVVSVGFFLLMGNTGMGCIAEN